MPRVTQRKDIKGWSERGKHVAHPDVEPVEKGSAKILEKNDLRICDLSDDLGSSNHFGTPDLDIF